MMEKDPDEEIAPVAQKMNLPFRQALALPSGPLTLASKSFSYDISVLGEFEWIIQLQKAEAFAHEPCTTEQQHY